MDFFEKQKLIKKFRLWHKFNREVGDCYSCKYFNVHHAGIFYLSGSIPRYKCSQNCEEIQFTNICINWRPEKNEQTGNKV